MGASNLTELCIANGVSIVPQLDVGPWQSAFCATAAPVIPQTTSGHTKEDISKLCPPRFSPHRHFGLHSHSPVFHPSPRSLLTASKVLWVNKSVRRYRLAVLFSLSPCVCSMRSSFGLLCARSARCKVCLVLHTTCVQKSRPGSHDANSVADLALVVDTFLAQTQDRFSNLSFKSQLQCSLRDKRPYQNGTNDPVGDPNAGSATTHRTAMNFFLQVSAPHLAQGSFPLPPLSRVSTARFCVEDRGIHTALLRYWAVLGELQCSRSRF